MAQRTLVLAYAVLAYVFFGTAMEERDLIRAHGEAYEEYRRTTPMIVPFLRLRSPAGKPSRTIDQA